MKCKFPTKADNDAKVDSSPPVNPRKKKKKPPSARRRAKRRQQRFLEKKAAEKATPPKRSVSQATILKKPESVPKELDLSPEIRDQERVDQSVWVESETSSETNNSVHLDNQISGVSLPALIQEEQEILKDCLELILTATTILVTQEFVLTVTLNQKKVPNSSGAPAVTSPDFVALTVNGRTGEYTNLPALLLPKGLQQRLSYMDLSFSGLLGGYFTFLSLIGVCCDMVCAVTLYIRIYSDILTLVKEFT